MIFNTNKEKGNAGLALAIAYFGSNGYTVSIPLNDTQDYDIIVEKDGKLQTVQCKATGQKVYENNYSLSISSCGGTNGKRYKSVKDSNVDLLFALREDGIMYVIPIDDIKSKTAISLSTEKSKYSRKDDIDYSQYIVTL